MGWGLAAQAMLRVRVMGSPHLVMQMGWGWGWAPVVMLRAMGWGFQHLLLLCCKTLKSNNTC
jgi:hypothetical protein